MHVYVYSVRCAGEIIFDIDNGRETTVHTGPTQHFTIIFNTFVMMTLFNEINARKIHGQRNVFEGLNRNPLFIGIWIGTLISQVRSFFLCIIFEITVSKVGSWVKI